MSDFPATTEATTWLLSIRASPPTPWTPATLACTVYAPDGSTQVPSVSAVPALNTALANAYQAIWTASQAGDYTAVLRAADINGYSLTLAEVHRMEAIPLPSSYPGV
jgi:hypothetical protein